MRSFARPTSMTWAVTLLSAGLAGNAFLMCGANLVAFAAVAALTLRSRTAAVVSLGVWIESQVLGFTVFGYPRDTMTLAWGAALGAGTLAGTLAAVACRRASRLFAFVAAFVAYESTLVAFALLTHSGLGAFSPRIVLEIGATNALVALGAALLYVATGTVETAFARATDRRHV